MSRISIRRIAAIMCAAVMVTAASFVVSNAESTNVEINLAGQFITNNAEGTQNVTGTVSKDGINMEIANYAVYMDSSIYSGEIGTDCTAFYPDVTSGRLFTLSVDGSCIQKATIHFINDNEALTFLDNNPTWERMVDTKSATWRGRTRTLTAMGGDGQSVFSFDPCHIVNIELNCGQQVIQSDDSMTLTYEQAEPAAINATVTTDVEGASTGTLTYSSSDNKVVRVDRSSGELDITGAGTAIVTITAARTVDFEKVTKNVTVTVKKADEITAKISGNNATYAYSGAEYSVSGFKVEPSIPGEKINVSLKPGQEAMAKGTDVLRDGNKDISKYMMNLTAEMFEASSDNYNNVVIEVKQDGYLQINPRTDVVVKVVCHPENVTYDGKEHYYTGYDIECNDPNYDAMSAEYTEYNQESDWTRGTDVGTYNTYDPDNAVIKNIHPNYDDVKFEVTGTVQLNIVPASVTVTADAAEKTFGADEPELTATVTGLVNDEPESKITYTVARESGENAGTYTITPSGDETQGNYSVTYAPGTFTIKPAEADDPEHGIGEITGMPEFTYDKTEKKPEPIVKNAGGDTLTKDVDYTVEYVGDCVSAGTATIKINGKGNYSGSKNATYTIKPADATIIVDYKSKIYNNPDPELTGTVSGLFGDDKIENIVYTREAGEDVREESYRITVESYTENPNYNVSSQDGEFIIRPSGENLVTVEGTVAIYDGQLHGLTSVTATAEGSKFYYKRDKKLNWGETAPEFSEVGTYTVYVTATCPPNYSYAPMVSATIEIKPAPLTVTTESATQEYNEQPLTATDGTLSGLVNGETATLTATGSQTDVGKSSNTYEIDWGTTKSSNYEISENLGTLEVTPAGITLAADPEDVEFDGAPHMWEPQITGVNSKVLTRNTDYTVSYDTEDFINTGEKTATITGCGNYTGELSASYSITPSTEALTVKINGKTVDAEYDGQAHTLSAADADKAYSVSCDNPAFDISKVNYKGSASVEQTDAGKYELELAASDFESIDENYSNVQFEVANAVLNITRKPVKLIAQSNAKVYKTADPTLTAKVSGLVEGESEDLIKYTATRAAGEDVGEYDISLTAVAEQGNYAVTTYGAKFFITKADSVTVHITGNTASKAYSGTEQNVTGFDWESEDADDTTASVDLALDKEAKASGVNVGAYVMKLKADSFVGSSDNYRNVDIVIDSDGELTIKPAEATVTAKPASKKYKEADPELEAEVSGLVNGESESVLSYSISRQSGEIVGSYPITVSGNEQQGNYHVTFVSGAQFTIKKSGSITVNITGKVKSETYTGTEQSVTGFDWEIADGCEEDKTLAVSLADGMEAVACGTDVGDYMMNLKPEMFKGSSANIENVEIVIKSDGKLTVTPAEATVSAKATAKCIKQADPKLDIDVTGLVNGEDKSVLVYEISREPGEEIGTYPITVTGDELQGNYKVTFVSDAVFEIRNHEWSGTSFEKANFGKIGGRHRTCIYCGIEDPAVSEYYPAAIPVLSASEFVYNKGVQVPSAGVIASGAASSYYVHDGGSKNVGIYYVTVNLLEGDRYSSDSRVLSYEIKPKGTGIKKPKKAKKAFTAKWKRQKTKMSKSRISGYQVEYSTDSSFSSSNIVTVKGYKKTKRKIKGLLPKTTYYVRVRTYMNVSGGTCFSYWSGTKAVKTK